MRSQSDPCCDAVPTSVVPPRRSTLEPTMTAKEKLRKAVEGLSEADAAAALDLLARREEGDALGELLENAPIDDELTTPEEDEGAREALAEIARGEVVSADEIKREIA